MTKVPHGMEPRDFFLTSASVEQFEVCPATRVFRSTLKEEMHPGMWWGIFIHRFLEYAQTRGRDAALAYVQQKFRRGLKCCQAIDVASIPLGDVEVALAHDVYQRRSRQLFGRNQWPDPARETFGRADLLFRDKAKDNRPHIADYKCGAGNGTPVGDFQLLGLAAAVADWLDWRQPIDVSIVAVRSTGELVWRTLELSADTIAEHSERTRKVHLQVMQTRRDFAERGVVPEFVRCSYCDWCELRPSCPAHKTDEKVDAAGG